jgi:hypothetical protein
MTCIGMKIKIGVCMQSFLSGAGRALGRWINPKWIEQSGPWVRWSHYRQFVKDGIEYVRDENDQKHNETGRLPPDEGVQLASISVVELYTPSQVEGLKQGIARMGWDHGRSSTISILTWAADARRGDGGAWASLGMVTSERHIASERIAELPRGVHAAFPVLMSLTPSITALITAFMMDDTSSKVLDDPLRATFATRAEERPGLRWWNVAAYVLFNSDIRFSRTIHDPHSERRRAVAQCASRIETACTDWVREKLPGVFSSGLRDGVFPTATLIITEKCNPGKDNLRSIHAFEGLSIDRDFNAWISDQWPCARLVLPGLRNDDGLRLAFACRRRDAFPNAAGYHDATSNWTISQRANDTIREFLARWALTSMLDGYRERLSVLRDRSAAVRSYRSVRDLKQLRSLIRAQLYDIDIAAHEIRQFTNEPWYHHDVLHLRPMDARFGGTTNLASALRDAQSTRADQVARESDLLKSVLSLSSNVSQTITNLRIQWLMVILTSASIGIAVAALYVSVRSMPK